MRGPFDRWPVPAAHDWLMARGVICMYSLAPDHDPFGSEGMEHRLIKVLQRLHRTRPVGNGTAA